MKLSLNLNTQLYPMKSHPCFFLMKPNKHKAKKEFIGYYIILTFITFTRHFFLLISHQK